MKWISIEDEFPEIGVEVLVYVQKFGSGSGYMKLLYREDEGKEEWYDDQDVLFEDHIGYYIPTYWTYLTFPPNR